jgi:hypothetical protein
MLVVAVLVVIDLNYSPLFYSPPSAPSRGFIYDSLEAVLQQANREIDDQAHALAANTEIGKQLGIMDRGEWFDSLDFDNDLIFHSQVEPMAAVKLHVCRDHRQRFLPLHLVSPVSPS